MSENSKIAWCDHTINLWWGCTKVSPGCANCYADALSHRFGKDIWGPGKPREDHRKGAIKSALKLDNQAANDKRFHCRKCGRTMADQDCAVCEHEQDVVELRPPPRVFCASMSDWLDSDVPPQWRADLLRLIDDTPHLEWLLLSKRPEHFRVLVEEALMQVASGSLNADAMMDAWLNGRPPHNVWIGTSVEDQWRADERIPALLKIPARIRFLSCEPLLGPIQFKDVPGFNRLASENLEAIRRLWVIAGGESGPGARPMDLEWARALRAQCRAADVPFFMKQMGGVRDKRERLEDLPEDLRIREFPCA